MNALSAASSKHNKLLKANRLFVQKRFEILETYKKGTSEFYDAKLAQVDYIRNVDRARGKINRWVEKCKQLANAIKDLLQKFLACEIHVP